MKKLISTVIALSFVGTVGAEQFYIDIGSDQGGNDVINPKANGLTTTGWLNQLSFLYESTSVITDGGIGGVNVLSAGDTILSKGGINNDNFVDPSGISTNLINGFEPAQTGFGGPSANGYGTGPLGWGLTFGFPDLVGTWTGTGFVYSSGTVSMYYFDNTMANTAAFVRLFDLNVSSGGDTGQATILNGTLSNFGALASVNGVDAADVFNFALGSFGDLSGPPNNRLVSWNASQDTQPLTNLTFVGGQADVGGTHNGSINFNTVPEPTTIAILGLGLLGLASTSRRKVK